MDPRESRKLAIRGMLLAALAFYLGIVVLGLLGVIK